MNTIPEIKQTFKNPALFDQALTHRSWVNENPNMRGTNERLEFLGDAILEFVVSSFIYKAFPNEEEGFLTALRANIVNTKSLAALAEHLSLGDFLFLSKGEEQGGGRANHSLLADTVEALIGALYIDQDFEASKSFIEVNLLEKIDEYLEKPLKDPKSRLQELVQAKGMEAPKYRLVREEGPDHSKEFIIEVFVGEKSVGTGSGKSKSTAEQAAAEHALETLAEIE